MEKDISDFFWGGKCEQFLISSKLSDYFLFSVIAKTLEYNALNTKMIILIAFGLNLVGLWNSGRHHQYYLNLRGLKGPEPKSIKVSHFNFKLPLQVSALHSGCSIHNESSFITAATFDCTPGSICIYDLSLYKAIKKTPLSKLFVYECQISLYIA